MSILMNKYVIMYLNVWLYLISFYNLYHSPLFNCHTEKVWSEASSRWWDLPQWHSVNVWGKFSCVISICLIELPGKTWLLTFHTVLFLFHFTYFGENFLVHSCSCFFCEYKIGFYLVNIKINYVNAGWWQKEQSVWTQFMLPCKIISWSQDTLLRCWSLSVLHSLWMWWSRLPHGWIFFQGKRDLILSRSNSTTPLLILCLWYHLLLNFSEKLRHISVYCKHPVPVYFLLVFTVEHFLCE